MREILFLYGDDSILPASSIVVEMLQSLHSLQQENQRLQDQILSLTAKKERLQLLNTELAVPFPPHILSMHSTCGCLHPLWANSGS